MTRVVIGVVAAILVLTVGWWFAFYSPANEQQEALEAETATLEQQATQLRTQLAQLNEIRDQEVAIRADLARLEQFIPTNPSQASLIRQVQAAADAAGVEIFSVAFSEPEAVPDAPIPGQPGLVLGRFTMTAEVRGGYFQVVDLFRRIEVETSRAVLVETLDLTEGEDGFPQLTGTFTADVFALITRPVDPNAAPVETPAEGADGTAAEGAGVEDAPENVQEAADDAEAAQEDRTQDPDAQTSVAGDPAEVQVG